MKAKLYTAISLIVLIASFSAAQTVQTPKCIWAKTAVAAQATASTDVYNIASDNNGNVYVTGTYTCGSITFGSTTLTGNGFFIAKYDSSGNVLWAKSAAGGSGSGVATDGNGNVYVTGSFTDTITFGGQHLTSIWNFISNPSVFVVKYNSSGNVVWAKEGCSFRGCNGYSIATDNNSNVFVTGTYAKDSIIFDNLTVKGSGVFTAKYDSSGNILWGKSSILFGGNPGGIGNGITTDADGSAFAVGTFYGDSVSFGGIKLINPNPTSGNSEISQMFVVKYNPSGNVLWAKIAVIDEVGYQSFNSMPIGGVHGLSADNKGDLYVTGGFYGKPSAFGSVNLTDNTIDGSADIFIVKYSPAGGVVWAKEVGGDFDNVGLGISADNNDNIYVTGSFNSSTIYFGSSALSGTSDQNVFIAKYDSSGNPLQALTAGGPSFPQLDFGSGVSATLNGSVYVTGIYSDTIQFDNKELTSVTQTIFLAKFNGTTTTGINQVSAKNNDISIYPNPTNNKISVRINQSATDLSTWSLEVIDELGRTVFTKASLNYNNDIDLSQFPNGLYFVSVVNNTGRSVFPVVKQN